MTHTRTAKCNPKKWIGVLLALALMFGIGSQALASAGNEIVEQRTLTSKTYDNGDGTFTLETHVGHIHYGDKATGTLKECDTSLVDMGDKWVQTKASYECEIPKYADGDFVFVDLFEDKDQTVVMRPTTKHVPGEIDNSDGWVNKRVLYRNAYGKGLHLRVTAGNTGLFKEVIIEKKPEPLRDLSFDFEITPPSEEYAYVFGGGDEDSPKKVLLANLTVSGNQQLLLGQGSDNAFTRIRKIRIWDSAGEAMAGRIAFNRQGSELHFQKIVPREFLATATYPVYTDDTVTYYAGAGDGYTNKGNNTNWDTTHNAATSKTVQDTVTSSYFCRTGKDSSGNYIVTRVFFPFNTAGLPDAAVISDATLSLYVSTKQNTDNDGEDFFVVVQTSQPSTSSLTTADYVLCGSVHNPIEGSNRVDMGNISTGGYNNWTLNATGLGWISKTGWTKLGMREGHDILDHAYVGAANSKNRINGYWSEYTGTTYDPKLSITYAGSPMPTHLKVTGDGTMGAGGSQQITITAYDQVDNVATGYTGDKTLTFSGANDSPNPPTSPTCQDKWSADIAFGSATVVTFTDGVGTCTMKLYKAETAHIDVSDGTISSEGDASYGLEVVVTPAPKNKLLWVTQPSSPEARGELWAAFSVEITDEYGNRTSDIDTVTVTPSAGPFGGTSAKAAVAGLATFDDIAYDTVATITVTGTAAGLTSTPASNSVVVQVPVMAGHITHFVSDKGPQLPQNETGCTTCHAAGNLQCDPSGPLFADSTLEEPRYLANTTVCDKCHSQGGVFDGVGDLDPGNPGSVAYGAKYNWRRGGVYNEGGDSLKDGKEKWCAGCHDDEAANSKADGTGISAPNVMGDSDQIYGYYASGHGRSDVLPMSDINLKCDVCHDLARPHIDGDPRTYAVNESAIPPVAYEGHDYQQGYRLRDGLEVPYNYSYWPHSWEPYGLCGDCHMEVYGTETNFRFDGPTPSYLHIAHLQISYPQLTWDSDNDRRVDSNVSCPTCHNVHGAPMTFGWDPDAQLHPNPVMIRHGELTNTVPGLHFIWFDDEHVSGNPTSILKDSRCGQLWADDDYNDDPSCAWQPCHSYMPYYNRAPIQIEPGILVDDFEGYLNDATLQLNWKQVHDAKLPKLEPQSTGEVAPQGTQCMKVRINWTRTTEDEGIVKRLYDPYVDLTGMDAVHFYIKLNNTAKFTKIRFRVKKDPENTWCYVDLLASELQDGVWELVSFPRSSFSDTTWGKINSVQFRIFEASPSSTWAQNVWIDDIHFTP